ncbi:MAG: rRNA maturation RNase YbeY [Dehalococcoidales bacterium]
MEINVLIEENFGNCPEASWLRGVVEQTLITQNIESDIELGLVITTQEKVQELNLNYRGEDKPTDVLAFYMVTKVEETGTGSAAFVIPPDGVRHLGEVIISYPQAVVQAEEHQHSIKKEIAILIIHGILHLLGYDHDRPEPERQMRAREMEIISQIEEGLISSAEPHQ